MLPLNEIDNFLDQQFFFREAITKNPMIYFIEFLTNPICRSVFSFLLLSSESYVITFYDEDIKAPANLTNSNLTVGELRYRDDW